MFQQEIIPMQGYDFEIPFYQYVEVILVRGSFLESSSDFTGPKSNIQIEI